MFDFLNCSRVFDFARSLVQSSAVNSAFYWSGIYFISLVRFFWVDFQSWLICAVFFVSLVSIIYGRLNFVVCFLRGCELRSFVFGLPWLYMYNWKVLSSCVNSILSRGCNFFPQPTAPPLYDKKNKGASKAKSLKSAKETPSKDSTADKDTKKSTKVKLQSSVAKSDASRPSKSNTSEVRVPWNSSFCRKCSFLERRLQLPAYQLE